jgi:hypothetical protein
MVRTLKRFGYWSPPPAEPVRRRTLVMASKSDDVHYEMKKSEITRAALEQVYTAPYFRIQEQITPRQMRLKMILVEALDIAHGICEHGTEQECRWAWEMVDEIDDAATRAGVFYR